MSRENQLEAEQSALKKLAKESELHDNGDRAAAAKLFREAVLELALEKAKEGKEKKNG